MANQRVMTSNQDLELALATVTTLGGEHYTLAQRTREQAKLQTGMYGGRHMQTADVLLVCVDLYSQNNQSPESAALALNFAAALALELGLNPSLATCVEAQRLIDMARTPR